MRRVGLTLAVTGAVLGMCAGVVPAAADTARVAAGRSVTSTASAGGGPTTSSMSPSQLQALDRARRLSAVLGRRGAVTGLVLRPGGKPAADVCVQARGPLATRTVFTRPDGRFIISGLPLGSYRIQYRGCSPIARFTGQWYGGLTSASATHVQVTGRVPVSLDPVTLGMISPIFERHAPAPTAAIPGPVGRIASLIGLERPSTAISAPSSGGPAHITGHVTSRSGHPLAGVCVFAVRSFDHHFFGFGGSATGRTGTYTMRIGLPGRYLIDFLPACGQRGNYAPQLWKQAGSIGAATLVRVRDHQTVKNINAALAVGARIAGRVTAAGSHPGLGGICVRAIGTNGQRLFAGLAITRSDGTFTLHSLATGKYRVSIALGCLRPTPYLPETLSRPVQVSNGKTTAGIRATLTVGGSITGTVKNTTGNPLSGICVDASSGQRTYATRTAQDGTYLLEALQAGSYRMRFTSNCGSKQGYAPLELPGSVSVALGTTTPGVDAVLQPDGSITGMVENSSGAPLAGICVGAAGPGFGFAVTDASGRYTVRRLPAGSYQVEFIPGGQFSDCGNNGNYLPASASASVSSGAATTLNAVLPTGGVISGVVLDPHGTPLSGVCVFSNGRSPFASQIVTKSNGSYRLPQLFTGSYFVGFVGGCGNAQSVAPQAYRRDPTFFAPTSIPVTEGQVTSGIGARMRPGGTLTGKITDQSGQPLSNVCVVIFAITGGGGGQFADFEISRHGTYTSTNLPPGQYTALFSGLFVRHRGCVPSPYADQQFKGVGLGAAGDQVVVPGGRVTRGVNATLMPSGRISGVVQSADGKPLPGICVAAIDPATKAAGFSGSVEHGKYTIVDLPAGRYLVEFSNCAADSFFIGGSPNYANQWYKNSPTRASATSVVVSAGHTTPNIDAAMTKGGTITGHVSFKPTDRPVSLVCVFAFTPNFGSFGSGLTDRRGNYSINGLSTGRYLIAFVPCSFESALAAQFRAGTLSVVAGQAVHGVDESLRVGGSVSGAVSYTAGSGKTKPAPGTCIDVLPLSTTGVGFVALSENGGSYLATNLAPGDYQVVFGDPGCSSDSPTLSVGVSSVIKVTSRVTTSGVNATLRRTGGISGAVRGQGGPIPGICVLAVPARLAEPHGLVAPTAVGITAAAGRYQIVGLQPGTYRVEFTSGCGADGYATRWFDNVANERHATLVRVAAGAVTGDIGATLPRG